ncbi:hypothetical protein [Phenylobacterium aquaticum]|uniref:hypothetical protein n=1 Tax=Phenylobacterium aquaticum TaxID=1763816 RepID=UPI001F5DB05E|nr:hypothetical protein [Phenylobacterium aquaticum]MCI3134640.1 hypothetical protein [Phenylobacterium aquaticum]
MTWTPLIRQAHRWLSLAFALAAVANLVALALGANAPWLGFVAVVPLLPLLVTGLYLFALPYVARRPGRQGAGA